MQRDGRVVTQQTPVPCGGPGRGRGRCCLRISSAINRVNKSTGQQVNSRVSRVAARVVLVTGADDEHRQLVWGGVGSHVNVERLRGGVQGSPARGGTVRRSMGGVGAWPQDDMVAKLLAPSSSPAAGSLAGRVSTRTWRRSDIWTTRRRWCWWGGGRGRRLDECRAANGGSAPAPRGESSSFGRCPRRARCNKATATPRNPDRLAHTTLAMPPPVLCLASQFLSVSAEDAP